MVNSLQLAFEKATKKYFEQNSSDEEINLEYPDLKTNVFREKNFNAKSYTPKQLLLKEFANKTKESTAGGPTGVGGGTDKRHKDFQKTSATSTATSKHKDLTGDGSQKDGSSNVATPRGTKRKRKDKDKRRKKKTKSAGKANKRAAHDSSNEDEDDVIDDSDIAEATSDMESEDELNYPKKRRGSKPEKKKRKLLPVPPPSPPPPVIAKTPNKREKSAKKDSATKATMSKRKPKKGRNKEDRISEPDDSEGHGADITDGEEDEQLDVPKVDKKAAKSKKAAKQIVTKSKTEKVTSKAIAGRNRGTPATTPTKKDVTVEKKSSGRDDGKKLSRKLSKVAKKSSSKTSNKKQTSRVPDIVESDKDLVDGDNDGDDDDDDMQSISSDGGVIDYPVQTKAKKGKSSTAKVKNEDVKLSSKKSVEKENQNIKSKRKGQERVEKVAKKVASGKKSTSSATAAATTAQSSNIAEKRSSSLGSRSRSSSRSISPVFVVDLHKKYSQSASEKFRPTTTSLGDSLLPIVTAAKKHQRQRITTTRADDDVDMRSISSRSFSRSPSPLASHYSSAESLASRVDAIVPIENVRSPTPPKIVRKKAAPIVVPSRPETPDIKDKFDLIKERRSKLNQAAKDNIDKPKETKSSAVALSSAATVTSPPAVKNQTLKETIEKLKATNKTSKERAVLLDEIFGAKPSKEVRDERTIFERLRETMDPTATASNAKLTPPSKTNKADEYNFVDDLVGPAPPASKAKSAKPPKEPKTAKPRKQSAKAIAAAAASAATAVPTASVTATAVPMAAPKAGVNKSTNMEALELETEQTLKDINRWLEHTPRFSDFNSASNSPSRYNLLDDLDAKLDAADFRRPVTIPVPVVHKPPTVTPPQNGATVSHTAATATSAAAQPSPILSAAAGISSSNRNIVAASGTTATIAVAAPLIVPSTSDVNSVRSADPPVTPLPVSIAAPQPPVPSTPITTLTTHTTGKQTIQLTGIPPAPGPHKRDSKEPKRKTLKEKLQTLPKRKDIHRTIERLQPGKTKGNLLNAKSGAGVAADEHHAPGTNTLAVGNSSTATNVKPKPKEIKNSLVQPTSETGPKLSLGSVLITDGFGLGQQHNFGDDIAKGKVFVYTNDNNYKIVFHFFRVFQVMSILATKYPKIEILMIWNLRKSLRLQKCVKNWRKSPPKKTKTIC